jgi:D-alanyl-D-alanine dipeptidase
MAIALQFCTGAFAQPLNLTEKAGIYRQQAEKDSFQKMVELKSLIPDLVYDLRYATANNFTGKQLYRSGKETYLRLAVAKALQQLDAQLKKDGYGLKIFDAYRPYAVTKKMWDLVHDERYVANPANGSGHNRGLAVDLTIINLKDGTELDMGTGFDNFTDSAHHSFDKLPAAVLRNRTLLKTSMEKHGFRALETEWWHYSWPNDRNYAVLDIDFKKFRKKGG